MLALGTAQTGRLNRYEVEEEQQRARRTCRPRSEWATPNGPAPNSCYGGTREPDRYCNGHLQELLSEQNNPHEHNEHYELSFVLGRMADRLAP
jgi:hypothetical protein